MLFHGWNCYPQCHTPSSHCWHTWSPHFRSPENLLLVSNLRCFPTFSLEAPESCTRAHLSSPTFKQAYAHSLFLRRASDSYPLSLTLCLTQTDLPPRPHSSGQAETEARWSLSLALSRQHKNYRLSRGRLREVRRCCNGADFHAARENSSHTRDGSQPCVLGGGGLLAAGTLNTWMFSSKPPHSGPAPFRTPLAGVAAVAMSLEAFRR